MARGANGDEADERFADSRRGARAPGRRHVLLHHGRADAHGRGGGAEARPARHRRAPRAGRGDDGARLRPPAPAPRRVHGRLGPGRDQPGHRGRARLGRRRAGHRARRQRAGRHLGPRRVPGHGPAGDDGAVHQMGGARASPQAPPGAPERGVLRARCRASPARSISICRATCCSRRSTRPRSNGRSPGTRRRAAGRRRRRTRSRACSPCSRRRESPIVVAGGGVLWSEAEARAAGVRRAGRDPLLHHAAEPRHDPGGSPALLSDGALERVSRGRPDPGDRHAPQLRDRPRRAAALRCRGQARAHRHRPRRDRDQPAARPRHRRRRQDGAAPAAERREGPHRRGQLRDLARAAARAQQRQAGRAGGAARLVRGADPPAAPVQGDPRLHRPRCDPRGRRPGDPQLRPPDDPLVRARITA